MGMYTGIRQGLAAVEEKKFNQKKLQLSQDQEDRMQKQFELQTLKSKFDLFDSIGTKLGSIKKDPILEIEKINILKQVKGLLPKGSELALKLDNADLKTLQKVVATIQTAKNNSESNGTTWSLDTSETLFEDYYETTVVKESPYDVNQLASMLGVTDLDAEFIPGLTYSEALSKKLKPTSTTVSSITTRDQLRPPTLAEQNQIQTAYVSSLKDELSNLKNNFDSRIANNETVNQAEVTAVDEAIKSLSGTSPSTFQAVKIVGPTVGIKMLARNPIFRTPTFRSMFNQGLSFNNDAFGDSQLAASIRGGLIDVGDRFTYGGAMKELDEATKLAVLGEQ